MIYYPIEALKSAGIKEILIVTGTYHKEAIHQLLGNGKEFGVKFSYETQKEAGGIPSAIGLAERFVGKESFISINGDNIIFESLEEFAHEFEKGKEEARILLYKGDREEAKKSGVAVVEGDKVVGLVEKPENPPSNLISVGIYMYRPNVFEIIKKLKPSARGETEITEVNSEFMKRGTLKASMLKGKWLDAGDFDDLLHANIETRNLVKGDKK